MQKIKCETSMCNQEVNQIQPITHMHAGHLLLLLVIGCAKVASTVVFSQLRLFMFQAPVDLTFVYL